MRASIRRSASTSASAQKPLDRRRGRQDGSRAAAGLDEPAHQVLVRLRVFRFFSEPLDELTRRTAREGSESVKAAQLGKMLVPGCGSNRVVGEVVPVHVELAARLARSQQAARVAEHAELQGKVVTLRCRGCSDELRDGRDVERFCCERSGAAAPRRAFCFAPREAGPPPAGRATPRSRTRRWMPATRLATPGTGPATPGAPALRRSTAGAAISGLPAGGTGPGTRRPSAARGSAPVAAPRPRRRGRCRRLSRRTAFARRHLHGHRTPNDDLSRPGLSETQTFRPNI